MDPEIRNQHFEEMNDENLKVQKQILQKQLSTAIEYLGVDFILERISRNRYYENLYGRNSPLYTERRKSIDDLNEICEVLHKSRKEFARRKINLADNDEETKLMNDRIMKKISSSNYVSYSID